MFRVTPRPLACFTGWLVVSFRERERERGKEREKEGRGGKIYGKVSK